MLVRLILVTDKLRVRHIHIVKGAFLLSDLDVLTDEFDDVSFSADCTVLSMDTHSVKSGNHADELDA